MSFPRYPGYKDSGVDWLGEIPVQWRVDRLKSVLAIIKNTVGSSSTDYTLLSLTLRGVIPRDLDNPQGKFPAEFDTYQAVEPEDLIFCLFDVEETPRAVGISNDYGMITGAYTVARVFEGQHPGYFHYYYLSRDQYKALKMYYTGLRNVIRKEVFYGIPCPIPPVQEQIQITKLLNRETAKIDALVAEQEQLIALLKEKRQAVISHAVTKGLDPPVPMKDSGVEWLGEVPAHWGVVSLRRVIAAIEQGWSPECYSRPAEDEEWGVLKAGCLNGGQFREDENKALPPELLPEVSYEVQVGDVLMSRASGSPELVGSTALVRSTRTKLMLSDKIFRLRLEPSMQKRFFVAALNARALRSQIENALSGGNGLANNLPQSSLLTFWIVVPPLPEQDKIADFIDMETQKIDALINEANSAINLLQERRIALISAAVTGQIDVRSTAH